MGLTALQITGVALARRGSSGGRRRSLNRGNKGEFILGCLTRNHGLTTVTVVGTGLVVVAGTVVVTGLVTVVVMGLVTMVESVTVLVTVRVWPLLQKHSVYRYPAAGNITYEVVV